MAIRGRDADDLIATLMNEMGQQQGYREEATENGESDSGGSSRKNNGKIDRKREQLRTCTPRRRLIPELPKYPNNSHKAGSTSIWNPLAMGNCGSDGFRHKNDDSTRSFSFLLPTNPRIEVIRRRVFEKFRQETHTLLQEFQTKNLSFLALSSSTGNNGSFSKNKNKMPIPSMIDKWHMDAKLEERNFLLQKTGNPENTSRMCPSATSTADILREIANRKQQGKDVYDPILLNKHAPSIFVENILKPQVQKMWQQNGQDGDGDGDGEPQLPPKFNKKAQQVKRALFRLICEANDSFEKQLLQDARQESTRSTTAKKSRTGNRNDHGKQPKISRTAMDDDYSSASLVRVTYSGVTLKLHPAYLEKLQRLYDRTKERRQQKKASECFSDMYHSLSFEEALFCLLCRYDMIQGAGLQAGVPGAIMDVLLQRFDCRMECFASPLNCRYDRFASAFVDVDAPFGSQGSFFELPFLPKDGNIGNGSGNESDCNDDDEDGGDDPSSLHDGGICYEANPPFCEGLILQLSDEIHRILSPKASERPIMFVVFVPAWRESQCYQALLANERLTQHLLLKQGEHWYAEGTQHRRKDSFRVASFDTSILFYQNETAKKLWNVQNYEGRENIVLTELTKAFGQDPGEMQKEFQTISEHQTNGTSTVKSTSVDVPGTPANDSASGRPPLARDDKNEGKNNKFRSIASSARKSKKDSGKEKKRRWNQLEEGKAQLDLLASLGLSSTTSESEVGKKSKSYTDEKVKRRHLRAKSA
eukprot:CAMPEP_0172390076 /NCGR_PEP_ID=MMETSP1061-20121228/6823_1 /TAXON_ID=37318 /ORGANISM="Pseudo-nitzschia pungens, Strain cf. pungens" /LENGTH=758 /DNA_ID=CAMNT_0013120365 /DNA_START=46 /DNA_END=2318 /DNA_ORIENTATION=+